MSAHCGGCPAHWTNPDAAHCGACHATFGNVALFTRHRRPTRTRGQCLPPSAVGLSQIGGIWQLAPLSVADRRALWLALQAQAAPLTQQHSTDGR